MNRRKLLVSVLMLVSVLLSACQAQATPIAAPPIAAAPTTVPPTAVPLTTTPTDAPTQEQTPLLPWSNFKLPINVSFGSDWHVVDNLPHLFTISNGQVDIGFNIVTTARIADPVDGRYIPFPDDFVSWIKSNPDFKTGEPTPVTVGGISGVQIDAMPIWESTTTNKKTFLNVIDTTWNYIVNDGEWRFILLDNVNGERMLIMFLAAPGKTLSSVLQPQEAQSILDSVVFSTTAITQTLTKFASSTFTLPMTLSYGPDWSLTEYPNQAYLQKLSIDSWQLAFNLVDGATIADPNSAAEIPWPQDLVGYLKSNPYIEAGEPKPVMVGGFKGIQIDAYAKYTGDKRPFIRIAGDAEGWLYLDYEEMWRFIVLDDVNGNRLVITMTASPTSPTTPVTEFSMFADEGQKILDTVVFSKP